ncbi:MAG: TonB-dependent receptor [Sediminibacterium sp.]|nr:TonB-dependent receptor [Sediminibacterium sp.]
MKYIYSVILICVSLLTGYAQQTSTQIIKGQVNDEASKTPLPGVTVIVLNTTPLIGTTTDENGYFKLASVPLGRNSIKVSFMGYEPRQINDLVVTAGKEVVLNLSLTESISQLTEVEVSYDRNKDKRVTNNDMSSVSARVFNADETRKYAGALGDPSRMASNFAGVVAGNDSRNDIVVRGNSPNGMLWQMEGLNIPNPNHFGALNSTGGPVSILNNNNIDKSDFMTSAFPAQYGNALAGVFDLRLRNGNNEKHEFLGQVGFNGFELGAEGPLFKKGGASYLVNYRYSTLGVFQKLGIDFGTGSATPLYQDLNYKVHIPVAKRGKLSFFGIAGTSSVKFLGKEVDTTKGNLYSDAFSNTIVNYATMINGIAYEHRLGEKTSARLTVGYSLTDEKFRGDSISYVTLEEFKDGEAHFNTNKYSATFQLFHKFNSRHSLVSGFSGDYTAFILENSTFYKGSIERKLVDQNDNMLLGQAFTQWKYRAGEKVTFISGIHYQYLDISGSSIVEPRVGVKWNVHPKHLLSLGYGLHGQAQSVYTYFVLTPGPTGNQYTNKKLDFSKSHHAVLSHDWNLTSNLHVKTEAYYQYLFDVPVQQYRGSYSALNTGADFAPANEDSLVNKGTGQNYGAELTIEHYFHKGYYFLITSSLFNSTYKGSDKVERNTAFNTGFVLNVLGGKEFKLGNNGNVLAINIKLVYTGGRYLTPIDFNLSKQAGTAVFVADKAYSEKQPDYFRTDLKLAYRKEFKRSTMEFALDLQNVTNHKNVFRQAYNPRLNKVVTEYQQGFFPVPTFRFTF